VKDETVYLDHIIECIDWISKYSADGEKAFFEDRKTQSAVLRELQTLSESTQRLSPALKERHPEVFWQGITGFRNLLVHDYLGIKLERIWEIVEKELPLLRAAAETMRRELRNN